MLTAITVVHKTPKQYLGGEFVFDDYDLSIELENNSMILFPSFINHSVNNISVNNKLNGRFSITQFIGMTI
jgi:predicted 2-oxoglutarate/Fe(II)-dependent dioxygenase YbiX